MTKTASTPDIQSRREAMRRYEKTEKGKATRYKIMRKYDEGHRLENRARHAIRNSVFRGQMIRLSVCEVCHRKRKTAAYHRDFNKPFDVIEMCHECYIDVGMGMTDVES